MTHQISRKISKLMQEQFSGNCSFTRSIVSKHPIDLIIIGSHKPELISWLSHIVKPIN